MLFQEEDEYDAPLPFEDRAEAGRLLATKLSAYSGRDDVIVLGLPRGGVRVAFEVAQAFKVALDVSVVRKVGIPWDRELAMGAIAPGGVQVLDLSVIEDLSVPQAAVQEAVAVELEELCRKENLYRGDRPPLVIRGKTVILVDDGMATGCSILAAIAAARQQEAARIVVAIPVAATSACCAIRMEADEVISVAEPVTFLAVSQWYDNFSETTDAEVCALLEECGQALPCAA
jgi:putative phosphoribosyl transferase